MKQNEGQDLRLPPEIKQSKKDEINYNVMDQLSDLSNQIPQAQDFSKNEQQEVKEGVQCEPSQPLEFDNSCTKQKEQSSYVFKSPRKNEDEEKQIVKLDLPINLKKKQSKNENFDKKSIRKSDLSIPSQNLIEDTTKATTQKTNEQCLTNALTPNNCQEDNNTTYFLSSINRSPSCLQPQGQYKKPQNFLYQQFNDIPDQQKKTFYSQQQLKNNKNDCSTFDFSLGEYSQENNGVNIKVLGQENSSLQFGLYSFNKQKSNQINNISSIAHSDSVNQFRLANFLSEKKRIFVEDFKIDAKLINAPRTSSFKVKIQQHNELQKMEYQIIEIRNCLECNIEQRIRSKHCKICNRCVATYDHHCPWIGNCIGEKNKCIFWWFLLLQASSLLFVLVEVLMSVIQNDILKLPLPLVVLDFGLITCFLIMVVCLLIYHSYLASENITTWENAKWDHISYLKTWPENLGSPFSQGTFANIKNYCRWITPSAPFIQWRVPKVPQHIQTPQSELP